MGCVGRPNKADFKITETPGISPGSFRCVRYNGAELYYLQPFVMPSPAFLHNQTPSLSAPSAQQ